CTGTRERFRLPANWAGRRCDSRGPGSPDGWQQGAMSQAPTRGKTLDRAEAPEAGEERNAVTELVQQGGGEAVGTPSRGEPEQRVRGPRGLGRAYRRRSTYWIQYYDHGRLIRESTGSAKPSAAAKLLK